MSTLPPIGGTAVPPGPLNAPDARPGAVGFWLGAGAILLGLALVVAVAVSGFRAARRALTFPVPVDADGTTWIDTTGGKVVFVVGPSGTTGALLPGSGSVNVTGPDGALVAVSPYGGVRTTSRVDPTTGLQRTAVAVATFRADRPGLYHVDADGFAFGSTLGIGEGAEIDAGFVVFGVLAGGLLVLGGIVVVIVTAVRRGRRSVPPGPPQSGRGWVHPYGPAPYQSGGHAPTWSPPGAPVPPPVYPPPGGPWPAQPPAPPPSPPSLPPGWPGSS